MKSLQEEREAIVEEFAKDYHPCVSNCCNQKGVLTVQGAYGQPEQEQCEYCYRERFPIQDWLRQALLSHEEKVVARVREQIVDAVDLTKREIKHRVENYFRNAYLSLKQQGGVHIHLEEIQEIIDDSTPPGFALTLPITDEEV